MDSEILLFVSVGLLLLSHVRLVLIVDKVDNRSPTTRQPSIPFIFLPPLVQRTCLGC